MADPMYRQIADDLRRQIETGELPSGAQLPTELELREMYTASRNTVRDAVKLLITRGLVETRPGQGTFVVQRIVPFVNALTGNPAPASFGVGDTYTKEVASRLRTPTSSDPTVEMKQASPEQAAELKVEDGSQLVSRHQQRFIDGTPWSLQTTFYPIRLVEKGATRLRVAGDIVEGTVEYLEVTLGIKHVGYHDTITVRPPDEVESRFFRLPDDGRISVIETRRTGYDQNGTPIRLTVSVYPADRNQFTLNVGEVPSDVVNPPSANHGQDSPPPDGPTRADPE
jgi:GntR family transcriptional regulator